jgi:peptidoglycan/LPS O-acetylase OafA/YrhL
MERNVLERNRVARLLLVLYALGSVAVAIPLLFAFSHAGDLADTTSGKVLAAALLAMALGALAAARDPWQNRVMILVVIAFTSMSALAVVYRLVFAGHTSDPAWSILPFALAAPVLFALFYPRPPSR